MTIRLAATEPDRGLRTAFSWTEFQSANGDFRAGLRVQRIGHYDEVNLVELVKPLAC
jgi:hypothetical protein